MKLDPVLSVATLPAAHAARTQRPSRPGHVPRPEPTSLRSAGQPYLVLGNSSTRRCLRPTTEAEWKELGSVPVIRESWGLEDDEDPLDLASQAYGAKFNFVSGSPGYVGELYILGGDSIGEPMVLRRDRTVT